jgi:hypothetical protein
MLDAIRDQRTLGIPLLDLYQIRGQRTRVKVILDHSQVMEQKTLDHSCWRPLQGEVRGQKSPWETNAELLEEARESFGASCLTFEVIGQLNFKV